MDGATTVALRAGNVAGRPVVLRDRRTHTRTRLVSRRRPSPAAPDRTPGRRPPALRSPPAPPRARCRAAARGCPAATDPTPARALAPLHDRDLPTRNLLRGDHLHSPRPARADDARQRRPRPIEHLAGARHALPRPQRARPRSRVIPPRVTASQPPLSVPWLSSRPVTCRRS